MLLGLKHPMTQSRAFLPNPLRGVKLFGIGYGAKQGAATQLKRDG